MTDIVKSEANVPDLVNPRAVDEIDAGDIALKRLYRGEAQGSAVQSDLVPKGCIYLASDGDDDDPEVLVENADKLAEGEGVLVHVLHAWKGWNYTDPNTKEFFSWRYDDPRRHPDSRKAYHYMVYLPESDEPAPVKLTLAKSSKRVGDRLNYQLIRHDGADHELAFRLSLKKQERQVDGGKQSWFVWVCKATEADPKHVEEAASLVAFARAAAAAPPKADADSTAVDEGPRI